MAGKDKLKKDRQKSRFAAMEALRATKGFPVAPRKAMSQAKKTSKKLPYPVSPYPGAGLLSVYRWASFEWRKLGRMQMVAAPLIAIVALLEWEKEREIQDARWDEIERAQLKELAAATYGAYGARPKGKRKLLGIIPLPGGK